MVERKKITVVGSGYVGMSLSVLLAQHNDVTVLDIDARRVDKINAKQSTVVDKEIESFLAEKPLFLSATMDKQLAYKDASFVIVATPTNYDTGTNRFDTSSVDSVVENNHPSVRLWICHIYIGISRYNEGFRIHDQSIIFAPLAV